MLKKQEKFLHGYFWVERRSCGAYRRLRCSSSLTQTADSLFCSLRILYRSVTCKTGLADGLMEVAETLII